MSNQRFEIDLKENALDSITRALESFQDFRDRKEKMELKQTIMHLHHGVELLLKQILVQKSEYLIFEDLRDTTKKQLLASETNTGIFFLEKPPKTVTFEEAINRVMAFIKTGPRLDRDSRDLLLRLSRFRNQLEHYAITADEEEVVDLLTKIRSLLKDFFEPHVGRIKQVAFGKRMRQTWHKVVVEARMAKRIEQEMIDVAMRFNGQTVPGALLNVAGKMRLPVCMAERQTSVVGIKSRADLVCMSGKTPWFINFKYKAEEWTLHPLGVQSGMGLGKVWLVVHSEVDSSVREVARSLSEYQPQKSQILHA